MIAGETDVATAAHAQTNRLRVHRDATSRATTRFPRWRSRGLTVGSLIRYTADFLPLTINASAGKLIVPLSKYLRAASATACFMVGS